MIVGANAVMAFAGPRHAADLDVVVHLPFAQRGRLVRLLRKSRCEALQERVDDWGQRVAFLEPGGVPVEAFFTLSHEVYDREFARSVPIDVGGNKVPFISPEELVPRRLENSRLRRGPDFDDAESVLQVPGANFGQDYVRRHCGVYRGCALFQEPLGASASHS